jgi:glycosyltransferase involved in cell wall biosynthesis
MEAAATGLPIVATDIRGCRQVVEHEVTGLLVPARTSEPLAAAMDRMVADADLRRRMGDAAREKASREFDDRRLVDITLQTNERLLRATGSRPPEPAPS